MNIDDIVGEMPATTWHLVNIYEGLRPRPWGDQIRTYQIYPDGERRWMCPLIYTAARIGRFFKPWEVEWAKRYTGISEQDLLVLMATADGCNSVYFKDSLRHEMLQHVSEEHTHGEN